MNGRPGACRVFSFLVMDESRVFESAAYRPEKTPDAVSHMAPCIRGPVPNDDVSCPDARATRCPERLPRSGGGCSTRENRGGPRKTAFDRMR